MKKRFALFLLFALLLSGCNQDTKAPVDNTTVPKDLVNSTDPSEEETTEPEYHYSQQPMVAISIPVTTEISLAEDGTALSRYSYQTIQLVVQDQQVADSIIVDFLNRQDSHHASATQLCELAESSYGGNTDWIPYFYSTIYEPMRIDHSVLSLYGQTVIFDGGNHPHQECTAANYNMITGEVLTLGSILTNVDALAALCDLVVENMELVAEEYQLYEDFPEVVAHRFSREESYDEDWFFTQTGLNFFFEPYEVAPYISGIITVEVPYDQLTGIIDDGYFPAEEDFAVGSVIAESFDKINTESFTQIADITLDTDGEFIFVYTDGLVRNLRLDIVDRDEDNYTTSNTVFATYALTPGDGILIQMQTSDDTHNLVLSYDCADERITRYITMNPDDHSVVHLEEH